MLKSSSALASTLFFIALAPFLQGSALVDTPIATQIRTEKPQTIDRNKLISLKQRESVKAIKGGMANYTAKKKEPLPYRVAYQMTTGGAASLVDARPITGSVLFPINKDGYTTLYHEASTPDGPIHIPLQIKLNQQTQEHAIFSPAKASYMIIGRGN